MPQKASISRPKGWLARVNQTGKRAKDPPLQEQGWRFTDRALRTGNGGCIAGLRRSVTASYRSFSYYHCAPEEGNDLQTSGCTDPNPVFSRARPQAPANARIISRGKEMQTNGSENCEEDLAEMVTLDITNCFWIHCCHPGVGWWFCRISTVSRPCGPEAIRL